MAYLRVSAHLLSPLAGGGAPKLDSLLECAVSRLQGKPSDKDGWKIHEGTDWSTLAEVPIPLLRRDLGRVDPETGRPQWRVALCSDPILIDATSDGVDYINRRLDPANALAIDPAERKTISTSGGVYKSYRLPLRRRIVNRVDWFAAGDRKGVLKALKRITHIGVKPSVGYGEVDRWEAIAVDSDYSWFAPDLEAGGLMLMRTLPLGPWLPAGLSPSSYNKDFMAPCPPYWQSANRTEVVTPC